MKVKPYQFKVVAGNKKRLAQTNHTQIIAAKQLIPHTQFNTNQHINDIALIKLRKKLLIDDVHTAILSIASSPPKWNVTCLLMGWGRMYEASTILPLASFYQSV